MLGRPRVCRWSTAVRTGLVLVCASAGHAQVSLDGTTLCPQDASLCAPLNNPIPIHPIDGEIRIGADLGKTVGNNLFHSFHEFNVTESQAAIFSGPDKVKINNIISRVTGGNQAYIDGALRSTIQGADFFFVNPAGVIFGPNAKLEVSGKFIVTTANQLMDGDGNLVLSTDRDNCVLTSAPPSAFGFTTDNPATITVNGSFLHVANGQTLSLVGGDVQVEGVPFATTVDNPTLGAPGGRIEIISVASQGTVGANDGLQSFASLGEVAISMGAGLAVSGDAGGTVVIRSGRLVMTGNEADFFPLGGFIQSETTGNGDGAATAVDIDVRGDIEAATLVSLVVSNTSGHGRAGDIDVRSDRLILASGAKFETTTTGPGQAGDIHVHVNSLELIDGGQLFSTTFDAGAGGDGGDIRVEARDSITVIGVGFTPSGISTQTGFASAGDGGNVIITTKTLTVKDGAAVDTSAAGSGRGGLLDLTADAVMLSGVQVSLFGADNPAFIRSQTFNTGVAGKGEAGKVVMNVGSLEVRDGAKIGVDTSGVDDAGQLELHANRILITSVNAQNGENLGRPTGIFAEGGIGSTGDGGRLMVTAGTLEIRDGAQISASAKGQGDAGSVDVIANEVLLSGGTIASFSTGTGNAGDLTVSAQNTLSLENQSLVTTSAQSTSGGGIHLAAGAGLHANQSTVTAQAAIDGGNITMSGGTILELVGSQITAESDMNGGDISLAATNGLGLTDSTVTAEAGGKGGRITVDSQSVTMKASQLIASSTGGDGGGITVTTDANIDLLADSVVSTQAAVNGGDITISSGTILEIFESQVSAESAMNGGSIALMAPLRIRAVSSTLTARAGQDGAEISIDPVSFILQNSLIDGRAGGRPVAVTVVADIFLCDNCQILTGALVAPPELDLTGSLAQLPESLVDAVSGLSDVCSVRLQGDISSFVVVGRGGLPIDPGRPQPAFHLPLSGATHVTGQ